MKMLQLTRQSLSSSFRPKTKSITEMEHSSYFPNWALSDFCLFPKINSALKGQKFQDNRGIKKCDNGTESYSTAGVPKLLPTVAVSLG